MSQAPLFQPLKVGRMDLTHRVVMAPMTRFRADDAHVHTDLGVEYYRQRASTPGTLLITEGTLITEKAGLYPNVPGIWTQDHIAAWKKITDAVHEEGSYIYLQLWSHGRAGSADLLKKQGFDLVSSGDIPMEDGAPKPRPLTKDEIDQYVEDYAQATKNALEAGFDGVELHNANGYLPDQFLQDTANNRTDEYGGSIENRARFSLRIIDAITSVAGQDRVGIRLSPFSSFQGMRMADPVPQFTYLAEQLAGRYPNLAYLHAVESRVSGITDIEAFAAINFIHEAWGKDRVFLRAGGYKRESSLATAHDEPNTGIVVGRLFISNPDLPRRWKNGVPEEPYDRNLFYNAKEAHGYKDYKAATEPKL
ncbi:putative nadh:flavin oxidoreductase nadh oxidase family protein [Phaeomoniella chlamydospora]|uniref:Putative nadh:flavin oxidoreductase nadh oxidase family protein n=1 Tax=Phaeomoniella chlamydospora TaxID=158046 RepID=A0A0G2EEJ4_PHACM|nr:putative nadh:flavin oxidoreductase nadh oxidase family protein [Phaeomoniella chlamydospora]